MLASLSVWNEMQICIMAQLMPLPLTVSCSSKSRLVLPFWYQLIRVVPDEGPLNGCCCCCCCCLEGAQQQDGRTTNVASSQVPNRHRHQHIVLADSEYRSSRRPRPLPGSRPSSSSVSALRHHGNAVFIAAIFFCLQPSAAP